MGQWLPPYMNKHIDKLKKDVIKAERKELKAKKNYEFAKEYTSLCKKQLEEANENK